MALFRRKHPQENFFRFIAERLYDSAPGRRERDELQSTIYGAHSHHLPQGSGKKALGLKETITQEHGWIIGVIRSSQETWKRTHKELPFDLLDAQRGAMLQDLGEALGNVERSRLNRSGEQKG